MFSSLKPNQYAGNKAIQNYSLTCRVKAGKFGHQVNSDTNFKTVEIQMSRLIRIFSVCLVNLFFIPIIEL